MADTTTTPTDLQQYKDPTTSQFYGYSQTTGQGVAFSDPTYFNQYFKAFDNNAAAPTFDTSKLLAAPNQVLNVGQLQPASQLNLGNTNTSPTAANPDAMVAGAKTYQDYYKELTPEQTATQNKAQQLTNEEEALLPQTAGKATALLEEEGAAGVPVLNKQLADINSLITTRTASYNKAVADTEKVGGETPIDIVTGRQGVIRRTEAADIGLLQARALGLSGQIQTAKDTAARAIDLRYSAVEDAINIKQRQLDLLRPTLEKEDARQADALTRKYQDEQTALAELKAKQKDNVGLAFEAQVHTPFVNRNGEFFRMSDGLPYKRPEDFFKDAGVKSFGEAYQKGLVTDLTAERLGEINMVKELASSYQDAGILPNDSLTTARAKLANSRTYRKETYIAPTGGGGGGGYSGVTTAGGTGIIAGIRVPTEIAGDVEDVLTGRNTLYNIRQTMGRTNAAAAYMSQMRAAIKSVDPNFDFVASDAGGKFVSSSYYQKSVAAIDSVLPNIDKIVDLSNQVNRIGIRGVDELLQKTQVQIGNQNVSNFREAQKLIADEIGLALGQGSVSDMKLQLGFDVTDPALSPEVFASNMAIVKQFIENRKAGLNEQRYSSSITGGTSSGAANEDTFELNGVKYHIGSDGLYYKE